MKGINGIDRNSDSNRLTMSQDMIGQLLEFVR
jgi:hypothetical protein